MSLTWKNEGRGRHTATSPIRGKQLVIQSRPGRYGRGVVGYDLYEFIGPGENDWEHAGYCKRLAGIKAFAEREYV